MATDCSIARLSPAAAPPFAARFCTAAPDYWALTKPEINFLIAIATFTGFYLGCPAKFPFPFLSLVHTLLGTMLVAGGAGALNQYLERHLDGRMRRTQRRPVASGRLSTSSALCFGILLSLAGSVYLAVAVNALASGLALLTLASYLGFYTPLKRRTPLCTVVGALPGAMPPLIGWAAASGTLSVEAWVLFTMLFLWQFPHFMAIAWMYREDYSRAEYRILPPGERGARLMSWQAIAPSLALIPVSLWAMATAGAGLVYFVLLFTLSSGLFLASCRLAIRRSNLAARQLLIASIIYLPCVFLLTALGGGDSKASEVRKLTKPAQRSAAASTLNIDRMPR
jgi:protoheme IX farnesyltransferase